jgi:prevent-host-death family protein
MNRQSRSKSQTTGPTVSSAYAKTNLGELLKAVQRGQVVTIERYNKPVAILSPPAPPERRVPKFGTVKGAKILDPRWADPITEKEVDEMLKDKY